jgi:hypothetical protein
MRYACYGPARGRTVRRHCSSDVGCQCRLRRYCPSMSSPDDRPAEGVADRVDAALEEEREELATHAQQDAERDAKLAAALEKAKNVERST